MSGPASFETVDLRQLLLQMSGGDQLAQNKLIELFYKQFHDLAGNISRGNETMRPTVLVNELFLKLIAARRLELSDRAHFYKLTAAIMRNLLRDYYRRKLVRQAVPLEEWRLIDPGQSYDFVEVDEALDQLKQKSPRQAQVVELRVIIGLSIEETARALGVTNDRVNRDLAQARVFLRKRLRPDTSE
jgi:RNA polymerase sigma factor (TIGR02999 family)